MKATDDSAPSPTTPSSSSSSASAAVDDPLRSVTSLNDALAMLRDLRRRKVVDDDDLRRSLSVATTNKKKKKKEERKTNVEVERFGSNGEEREKSDETRERDETTTTTRGAKDATKEKESDATKKRERRLARPRRRRPIALSLWYDGASHSGFTETIGAAEDDSVERHLFRALLRSNLIEDRRDCGYSRAGRTDRGVSAHGQVVGLTVKSAFPLHDDDDDDVELPGNSFRSVTTSDGATRRELDYPGILNNLLPDTIRAVGWCPVTPGFSARFSAVGRTYRYFFVRRDLDLDAMRDALSRMVGRHDFRNLCKINAKEVTNFVRVVTSADVAPAFSDADDEETDDARRVHRVEISGNAFLWHQVRCVVAVLLRVGEGSERPDVADRLLDVVAHPRKPSYEPAPETPLVLTACRYARLGIGHTAASLLRLERHRERRWEEAALAAARARDAIEETRRTARVATGDVREYVRSRRRPPSGRRRNPRRQQDDDDDDDWMPKRYRDAPTMTWGEAADLIAAASPRDKYVPLMERAKGTTYEEKLHAIMSDDRKRESYEDRVLKKRKTEAEDQAFYKTMTEQGGSAWT